MIFWFDRHSRSLLWTIAGVAVALRLLLAFDSPWAFGYVWDLYHEGIQRLYATGHLPQSTDCWECWQPPLLFLISWPLYAIGHYVYPVSVWPDDRALRFAEAIPAGIVNINDGSTYWEIHLPFGGGSGTKSGTGRLGGRLTLEAMTEIKMITITRTH